MEIFAGDEGDHVWPVNYAPSISFNSLYLSAIIAAIRDRLGYRILEKYLKKKTLSILENEGMSERMYQTSAEMFALPGFSPNVYGAYL